jgi:hypothetical protein
MAARLFPLCLLASAGAQLDAGDPVLLSLRRTLREKEAELRSERRRNSGRQLSSELQVENELCSSGECRIELTTGIAGWVGGHATPPDFHWAKVDGEHGYEHGNWIGDSNTVTAPALMVASVSFEITEPGCASFDLAFAADGRVRSARLNGHALVVPKHSYRTTTAQAGTAGLRAARGHDLFSYGRNSLVLTVDNDDGALGLYVSGSVQLLCPLDEATISMKPAAGPVGGHTLVELRSNVQLYVERWIRCRFGGQMMEGTVVDSSAVRCLSPRLNKQPRGWVDVEIVTSHQGNAAVGVHYQGQHLAAKFYYHGVVRAELPPPHASALAPHCLPGHSRVASGNFSFFLRLFFLLVNGLCEQRGKMARGRRIILPLLTVHPLPRAPFAAGRLPR